MLTELDVDFQACVKFPTMVQASISLMPYSLLLLPQLNNQEALGIGSDKALCYFCMLLPKLTLQSLCQLPG